MTLRYAVIGHPVERSLSPALQNAAFRALGIDATYEAIPVQAADLGAAVTRLRSEFAGFNVTTPLKESIVPFLDGATSDAAELGAVNTVRVQNGRLTGHNTDGTGFVAAIAEIWRITPRGKVVCILGSGPAARAIAQALGKLGAARFSCWSRNPLTAAEIGPAPDAHPELLVSALPADAVIPAEVLQEVSGARYVFDVNYGAARSPLPRNVGEYRSDGLPLLLHQGALAFEWWTGKRAPLDAMRAALGEDRS
jgi:shikimate dehydrogenase